MKGCGILSHASSSFEMIIWCSAFNLSMQHVTCADLHVPNDAGSQGHSPWLLGCSSSSGSLEPTSWDSVENVGICALWTVGLWRFFVCLYVCLLFVSKSGFGVRVMLDKLGESPFPLFLATAAESKPKEAVQSHQASASLL